MSAVQKHVVSGKVSDLLTFKKKKIEKWNKKSQPQKLNSFTFSPLQMAEKPSYQLLHVSSWIAHMAKHLLVGGQREVFLMLTETCLKAASLD